MQDDIVIAINAPHGTSIEVPDPREGDKVSLLMSLFTYELGYVLTIFFYIRMMIFRKTIIEWP